MSDKAGTIIVGVIGTVISAVVVNDPSITGNISTLTQLVLNFVPVGLAVGTLVYAFKMSK